jgi:hypothetical protein
MELRKRNERNRNKGARELKCKNGKIERLKNENRNHGALKAQLQSEAYSPGTLTVQTRAEPSLLGLCRVQPVLAS